MDTIDVLKGALALVERPGGWGQGSHGEWFGCCCAYEAISEAAGPSYGAYEAATESLRAVIGDPLISVWNDAPERTQAEVVAAFRAAIAMKAAHPDVGGSHAGAAALTAAIRLARKDLSRA